MLLTATTNLLGSHANRRTAMNSEALELIQTRITFLERANTELSDVVYRQQQQIQALTAAIRDVSERLRATPAGTNEGMPEEERPPHY